MKDSGEISNLKAWLLALASLIDDILLLVILFIFLRIFHVKITWEIILIVVAIVAAFFLIVHKAILPSLRNRKITGTEALIGETGVVIQALNTRGTVKIQDEYWKAKSVEGTIDKEEEVEVVGISGLELEVKRKQK